MGRTYVCLVQNHLFDGADHNAQLTKNRTRQQW